MKVANHKVWIGGMVIAAIALLNREQDRLTVHLVDGNKNPVSASVTVQEKRPYPILGSIQFLPEWARRSMRSSKLKTIDGILKVRRTKAVGDETLLIITAKLQPPHGRAQSEFLVFLFGRTNGAAFGRWGARGPEQPGYVELGALWTERIKPEQTEISMILD